MIRSRLQQADVKVDDAQVLKPRRARPVAKLALVGLADPALCRT